MRNDMISSVEKLTNTMQRQAIASIALFTSVHLRLGRTSRALLTVAQTLQSRLCCAQLDQIFI